MSIHDDPPRNEEEEEEEAMTDHPVIAPEDIRPGDVVERRQRFTIEKRRGDDVEFYFESGVYVIWPDEDEGWTWHLVHRPDPDAEVVQAIRSASFNLWVGDTRVDPLPGLTESGDLLQKLREQGFDVVKRAET